MFLDKNVCIYVCKNNFNFVWGVFWLGMGICLYEYFNLKYFDFVLELLKYEIDVNVLLLIKCFL